MIRSALCVAVECQRLRLAIRLGTLRYGQSVLLYIFRSGLTFASRAYSKPLIEMHSTGIGTNSLAQFGFAAYLRSPFVQVKNFDDMLCIHYLTVNGKRWMSKEEEGSTVSKCG